MARLASAPGTEPRRRRSKPTHESRHLASQRSHRPSSPDSRPRMLHETDAVIEVEEIDKAGVLQRKWTQDSGHTMALAFNIDSGSRFKGLDLSKVKRILADAFLPVGFPHSVTDDYLAYQTYDSLQAFFSTISGLLSSRALLEGLGVGDASSSATYALILTILQDMVSRLATIGFAHRAGLAIEPECKRFRFLADLFNDTAFFLDLVVPALPAALRVSVLCVSAMLRALCGVAAGSSKAALSAHFARQDNMAELNAKEASQETAVGLVGLLVGTATVQVFRDRATVFWVMIGLVLAHLYMNYRAVQAVKLEVLNRQRMMILYTEYLRSGIVMTPAQVCKAERILLWSPIVKNRFGRPVARVSFASSYKDLVSNAGREIFTGQGPFMAWLHDGAEGSISHIKIMLTNAASPLDAMTAWALAMDEAWDMGDEKTLATGDVVYELAERTMYFRPAAKALSRSEQMASFQRLGAGSDEVFLNELKEKGWSLTATAFETGVPVRVKIIAKEKKEG
ncbi:hypothetical protein TD95_001361 [Thielaviopsis punctulata]|uniref:Protein root UVB sensitive/RUS domain-containing protein n=1 Tax=Thielaviopsis punctulata TaxID=72032 RepID=A0A0F4ZIJ3_9PEZI|nr:hypothetical protein TD95_001361 [Thielaviopsis punctulata]